MNCQSCRKRKVKCDRRRPCCTACSMIGVHCNYDAVPSKRGPKAVSMRGLAKRMNSLERQLAEAKSSLPTKRVEEPSPLQRSASDVEPQISDLADGARLRLDGGIPSTQVRATKRLAPARADSSSGPGLLVESDDQLERGGWARDLLDAYFSNVHNNPYFILDEHAIREEISNGQAAPFLILAISAVSTPFALHLFDCREDMRSTSLSYASRSRMEIDVDQPSVPHLQALLLLVIASSWAGTHQKSWMLLCHAIGMALALNLHGEVPVALYETTATQWDHRQLFWTCYVMERIVTCESGNVQLLWDESIRLRWPAHPTVDMHVLEAHNNLANDAGSQSDIQHSGVKERGTIALLEISKILGLTNQYLAAGGARGDSRFPWHPESSLSKIRLHLDVWITTFEACFTPLESAFEGRDCIRLVLSKLLYHLIHCLMYRAFLPVDFRELSTSGQHQSWQTNVTSQCLIHADAIEQTISQAKALNLKHWLPIFGYCIYTAGTVHIHGAHYSFGGNDVTVHNVDALSHDLTHLDELQASIAASGNYLRLLERIRVQHVSLIYRLSAKPAVFSQLYQMNDFFERYTEVSDDQSLITTAATIPRSTALDSSLGRQLDFGHSEDSRLFQTREMCPAHMITQGDIQAGLIHDPISFGSFTDKDNMPYTDTELSTCVNDNFIEILEQLAAEDSNELEGLGCYTHWNDGTTD